MTKHRGVYLVLFIILLYALQYFGFVPLAKRVVSSTFFTGRPEEGGDARQRHNEMTHYAYTHCNALLAQRLASAALFDIGADYDSWDLGYGRYLVRTHVTVASTHPGPSVHVYLCNIQHTRGTPENLSNWALTGLEVHPVLR